MKDIYQGPRRKVWRNMIVDPFIREAGWADAALIITSL